MKKSYTKSGKVDGSENKGLLIAHFGATAEVQDDLGQVHYCQIRKNLEPIITGDHVLWEKSEENTGVIVGCLPRKSLLARPEKKHKIKPIAANIDAMIIVTAPVTFSEYLIDRYLIAAENLNIPAIILLNKTDILKEHEKIDLMNRLNVYEKIGYPVIYSSIKLPKGLKTLEHFFANKTCVLVGTSGVGKSSIISTLLPEQTILIGETSAAGLGKHTTTSTRLYHLPQGGNLIDSPGIREFGLWHVNATELMNGFIEFKQHATHCKYRDCKHLKEPHCALRIAVEENTISPSRFESYKKMVEELKGLKD